MAAKYDVTLNWPDFAGSGDFHIPGFTHSVLCICTFYFKETENWT